MSSVPTTNLPARHDRLYNPVVPAHFPRTLSALRPGAVAWISAAQVYVDEDDRPWLLDDTRLWPERNAVANASIYRIKNMCQLELPRGVVFIREAPPSEGVVRPTWVYPGPSNHLPQAAPLEFPPDPQPPAPAPEAIIPARWKLRAVHGEDLDALVRRINSATEEGWEYVELVKHPNATDYEALMRRFVEPVLDDAPPF